MKKQLTKQERKDKALKEYEKIEHLAWKEYKKIKDPARKEYEKITDPARKEYEKITDPAWKEYDKKCEEIDNEEEEVKQAIKDLKDWLELHQDTLITGGTVWKVIEDKFGVWKE